MSFKLQYGAGILQQLSARNPRVASKKSKKDKKSKKGRKKGTKYSGGYPTSASMWGAKAQQPAAAGQPGMPGQSKMDWQTMMMMQMMQKRGGGGGMPANIVQHNPEAERAARDRQELEQRRMRMEEEDRARRIAQEAEDRAYQKQERDLTFRERQLGYVRSLADVAQGPQPFKYRDDSLEPPVELEIKPSPQARQAELQAAEAEAAAEEEAKRRTVRTNMKYYDAQVNADTAAEEARAYTQKSAPKLDIFDKYLRAMETAQQRATASGTDMTIPEDVLFKGQERLTISPNTTEQELNKLKQLKEREWIQYERADKAREPIEETNAEGEKRVFQPDPLKAAEEGQKIADTTGKTYTSPTKKVYKPTVSMEDRQLRESLDTRTKAQTVADTTGQNVQLSKDTADTVKPRTSTSVKDLVDASSALTAVIGAMKEGHMTTQIPVPTAIADVLGISKGAKIYGAKNEGEMLTALRAGIQNLEGERNALQEQLQQAAQRESEMANKFQTMEERLANITSDTVEEQRSYKDTIDDLREQLSSVQADKTSENRQLREHLSKMEAQLAEKAELASGNERLTAQLQNLRDDVQMKQSQITALETERNDLQHDLNNTRATMERKFNEFAATYEALVKSSGEKEADMQQEIDFGTQTAAALRERLDAHAKILERIGDFVTMPGGKQPATYGDMNLSLDKLAEYGRNLENQVAKMAGDLEQARMAQTTAETDHEITSEKLNKLTADYNRFNDLLIDISNRVGAEQNPEDLISKIDQLVDLSREFEETMAEQQAESESRTKGEVKDEVKGEVKDEVKGEPYPGVKTEPPDILHDPATAHPNDIAAARDDAGYARPGELDPVLSVEEQEGRDAAFNDAISKRTQARLDTERRREARESSGIDEEIGQGRSSTSATPSSKTHGTPMQPGKRQGLFGRLTGKK